ncbi:Ig-like domain-containing protein [uncultured Draconibacterium sp.]|uniref:Ig-like domain-containing protein n=1 Tax=uncultured Draconibacterium sp. TaxID=1573823 RepID=UPI0025DBF1A7|nr:Ig-like domain-containing protein [uncultured Draconibacterium sp.]
MKKLIYLTIAVILFSCSDEDNSLQSIEIDRDQITMHYDEDEQLGIIYNPLDADETPPVTWFSEDNNVVDVSSAGVAEGVRVGETRIMAQTEGGEFQDYCDIIIEPYSNLYAIPCVDLGCSMSDVKSFETRELVAEVEDGLLYEGDNSDVEGILYVFDSGKLQGASVLLEENDDIVDKLILYLQERYEYLGGDDEMFIFSVNPDVVAIITVTYEMGLMVTYMEDVRDKSAILGKQEPTAEQKILLNKIRERFK